MSGPEVCEHDRTKATCEACAHAAALADPARAGATRDELYPFPGITTEFLNDDDEGTPPKKRAPRKRTS